MAEYEGRIETATGAPIHGALVKAFEDSTDKLLSTTVSDELGKYTLTSLVPSVGGVETFKVNVKFFGSNTWFFNPYTAQWEPMYDFSMDYPVDMTTVLGDSIDYQVTEVNLEGDAGFHNPSFAQNTLSNFDVIDGNVRYISFAYREHDTDGYDVDWESTNSWNTLGTINVEIGEDDDDTIINETFANIPVNQWSNKYYEFRVKCTNSQGNLATFNSPIDGTITGATIVESGIGFFTSVGDSDAFINMTADGYYLDFYASNSLVCSRPVVKVDNDTIAFDAADGYISTSSFESITSVVKDDNHAYIYDTGPALSGQAFNGIADFAEVAMATNLQMIIDEDWVHTPSEGDTIPGTAVHLRWHNMYDKDIADLTSWPHIDGSLRDLTPNLLRRIETYKVFMYVSDAAPGVDDSPTNHDWTGINTAFTEDFPAPFALSTGEDEGSNGDGTDSMGQWYLIDEIRAARLKGVEGTSTEYITSHVNVPGGTYIAFWVGFCSDLTASESDGSPIGNGRPGDRPGGGWDPYDQGNDP